MALSPKFENFYSYFNHVLKNVSTGVCKETFASYLADQHRLDTPTCYLHLDCVLDNLRESTKSHIGSSSVVLGLTPLILSSFAPTVGEVSLISVRRPLLAFLLALASVTIFSTRLVDPITPSVLAESTTDTPSDNSALRPRHESQPQKGNVASWYEKKSGLKLLCAAEYLALLGAIVNTTTNSYELGNKAILAWKCNVSIFPLIWALTPAALYPLFTIPFRYSQMATGIRKLGSTPQLVPEQTHCSPSFASCSSLGWFQRWLKREFHISSPIPEHGSTALTLSPWSEIFLKIGMLCGIIHSLVGVAIFSSLLFVSVTDALVIVIRFGVSAAICYCVFAFELASMRPKCLNRPL